MKKNASGHLARPATSSALSILSTLDLSKFVSATEHSQNGFMDTAEGTTKP